MGSSRKNGGMALLSAIVLLLIRVAIPVPRKRGFSVFTSYGNLEDRLNLHVMSGHFSRLSFPELALLCGKAVRPAVAVEFSYLCFKRSESFNCAVFIGIKTVFLTPVILEVAWISPTLFLCLHCSYFAFPVVCFELRVKLFFLHKFVFFFFSQFLTASLQCISHLSEFYGRNSPVENSLLSEC